MKKLYTAIMIIALALFVSCDEQKAEDDITKAITKITDEAADVVDKTTPKPQGSGTPINIEGEEAEDEDAGGETESETTEDTPPPALTKPAVNKIYAKVGEVITFPKVKGYTYRLKQAVNGVSLNVSDENTGEVSSTEAASGVVVVATLNDSSEDSDPINFIELTKPVFNKVLAFWGTPITFSKVSGYTYTLKEKKTGIALSEATSDTMQVTATQSAEYVIIVAMFHGYTIESNHIEFARIQGNTLSFAEAWKTPKSSGGEVHQVASNSETVTGDDRTIAYSISPTGKGATIDSASGVVTLDIHADGVYDRIFIVTAKLAEDEKYERATATYRLVMGR